MEWITILATIAALISAWVAIVAVSGESRTKKAEFFLDLTDRYNTAQMGDAMYDLVDWMLNTPEAFAEQYKEKFKEADPVSIKMDEARRTVNRYFLNVAQLYEAGLIDHKFARMVTNFYGLNVYYQIVVPMNNAKYGADEHYPDILRKIRTQYANGEINTVERQRSKHPRWDAERIEQPV